MARSALCVVLAAVLLVSTSAQSTGTSRILPDAGAACQQSFQNIGAKYYANNMDCLNAINASMSAVPPNCPDNTAAGSYVQKCFNVTATSAEDWADNFIANCEVMNVLNRQGAGEAEGASGVTEYPSCFPSFTSLAAFESYAKGTGGGSGNSASAAFQGLALALAVAMLAAALMS